MSGSGDSSVGYVGAVGGSGSADCKSLRLDKALEAPVPAVVETLSVGDVLDVALQPGPPPVVALHAPAGLAGSVVPTTRLLECLRQGVAFEAEVMSANAGAVRVEVRAVQ
jgi:hypothetical protein